MNEVLGVEVALVVVVVEILVRLPRRQVILGSYLPAEQLLTILTLISFSKLLLNSLGEWLDGD